MKFKRRKNAAAAKLENEKQNLIRVNDILSELEKQVGPLQKQSEVAKVYLKKKEELKTLDVNVFLLENVRIREQLESVDKKFKVANDDLDVTSRKYEGIKEEYERVQSEIEMLEESINQARETLSNTGVMRERLEGEINVLKEQINSAHSNEIHLENRKNSVLSDIEGKNKDKEGILADKESIDAQVQEITQKRDEVKKYLEDVQNKIEELNNNMEVGKNTIIGELNQRATIKSKMGRWDSMLEQINIRKAELNSRILRAKTDEAERSEGIKLLEEKFAAVSNEITSLNSRQSEMEKELTGLREVLSSKDQKLRDTQNAFHQEKSKLDALTNIAERYDGYGGSVKMVMEQKNKEKGIIGVVADIIKVDKEYETAIETALGGNIQNIVTDDEETAKKMIGYLKSSRGGRATFLPLTSITNPQEFKNPEALKEKGAIGMADELVHTDVKYVNVAKAMLGRIMVVDNVDNAVKIARKYEYGIRMVTIEGELLVPGGAISGGAFKNNSNLLGRRREIEELEKKIKKIKEDMVVINQEIEDTKNERNKLRMGIENLKMEIQRKSIEQNTARISISQARERLEEEEQSYESMKLEQKEIETKILEIVNSKEAIQRDLKNSEELERKTQDQIAEFQKLLEEKRLEESKVAGEVTDWELKMERMVQTQKFHQSNVDRIEGEKERYVKELEEIEEALKQNVLDIESKYSNIKQIEETILASYDAETLSQSKLQEDTKRKEELNNKQKTFFNTREELAQQMSALDKEVYRLNAQKERLEESIESQINYMWDEYEITLSDAASVRDESMNDLPAMKRNISGLKDDIKKLGNVNVNAIEEYKSLMERYTFLKSQHDDLVEAEKTLEGIIAELDAAMRKQFTEKFTEIAKEFDKVFKELFGGGKGTLELMEEEDLLEAGIRIIAQPPGKKLQNMMQLSGGEKALTAIALLFAIQNLKPSPFCLLDEIEAALDESNVGRYAKYLHKLTKHTQFIVITHRRGTMESADRLYGITMQEKGVSTLVSVNLIDKDLEN